MGGVGHGFDQLEADLGAAAAAHRKKLALQCDQRMRRTMSAVYGLVDAGVWHSLPGSEAADWQRSAQYYLNESVGQGLPCYGTRSPQAQLSP